MHYFKIILRSMLCLLLFACNKNENYTVKVRGNVRNNCTGLAFKNATLNFSKPSNNNNTQYQTLVQTSDVNGDFDFGEISFTDKNSPHFSLGVPGYSNRDYELYGITVRLNKDEIGNFHHFGISASFKRLNTIFPTDANILPNDSMDLLFSQNTLRYFEPDRVTTIHLHGKIINTSGGINGYPMGWWQITLKKFKAGVNTTVYDSVYIDMGATVTYTIPW